MPLNIFQMPLDTLKSNEQKNKTMHNINGLIYKELTFNDISEKHSLVYKASSIISNNNKQTIQKQIMKIYFNSQTIC